jgi:3-hydroxyisobutyrate dehydrogenase
LNMMQAGIFQIYLEGFSLASKSGIKENIIFQVIENSAAKSGISGFKLPRVLEENFETHFSLKNMYKDLKHALRLALDRAANVPLSFALHTIYAKGMEEGLGEKDFCSLAKINKQLNGIDGIGN